MFPPVSVARGRQAQRLLQLGVAHKVQNCGVPTVMAGGWAENCRSRREDGASSSAEQ